MILFYCLFLFLIVQRFVELGIARRNGRWILDQGGMEIGENHYPLLVFLHLSFFLSLWVEAAQRGYSLIPAWPLLLGILLLTQALRYWAISSLGPFWNTRIFILPGATPVLKGPYRFFRHPNYVAVILELALTPLLFHCYITSVLFTLLNGFMLNYRIRIEEAALYQYTTYKKEMAHTSRFLPIFHEKE